MTSPVVSLLGGLAYADLNYCLFHGLCFHMLTSDMRINHYIW